MPRLKPPVKKPRARVKSRAAKTKSGKSAAGRGNLGKLIDLIAEAKGRGAFDSSTRARTVAKPTVANTPSAPFARIVAGAKTEDEQLRALELAAASEVVLPAEAFVVGQRVTATAITYSGHPRAGLTLWGVREDRGFSVGLGDVVFPRGSDGARFVSLYRAWLGFGELSSNLEGFDAIPKDGHKVSHEELASRLDLVVLACKSNALRCRVLGAAREVTLRIAVRDEVPGSIITVMPTKQWTYARHTYLAGKVLSIRDDVEALGLEPLLLHEQGDWDPETEYWGEEGDPLEEWAKPIVARGKRPMFEMEQVLPGVDPKDFDSDPIFLASDLNAAGDRLEAREVLMNLLAQDLRCLDAHAHLGNFEFDRRPEQALRFYEMGMSIGAFSVGKKFDGVLAWGLTDNRPFLRCMLGVGLCWWRLGKLREAAAVFRKMLWLNPSDNQGARFNLADVEAGKAWEDTQDGS